MARSVSRYSPAVEAAFPRMGTCAFCGADDQRHRVIDAIAERYRAGDSAEEIAEDYGIEPELVPVIASEPATRGRRMGQFGESELRLLWCEAPASEAALDGGDATEPVERGHS